MHLLSYFWILAFAGMTGLLLIQAKLYARCAASGTKGLVAPAKAGAHNHRSAIWVPAFAGTTIEREAHHRRCVAFATRA